MAGMPLTVASTSLIELSPRESGMIIVGTLLALLFFICSGGVSRVTMLSAIYMMLQLSQSI